MALTLSRLRHLAVASSLHPPTTLKRAIERCGFVQADPIRAPARAQDLMLRHRVREYRAGDLDRQYAKLGIEEDTFINYGFLSRRVQQLMHPRDVAADWPASRIRRAQEVLEFVRERGAVHPREVDRRFSHGTVTNYWGGSSAATTYLLEAMHYAGMLRVARRDGGVRIYSVRPGAESPPGSVTDPAARVDALIDVAVRIYSPLPAASLATLVSRLRYAVPQWQRELKQALERAKARLVHATVADVVWYWPNGTVPRSAPPEVRLLSPFDPLVWDRRRFELLWGWAYRFEAYTPVKKRRLGYYALPLLWRDQVVGWANVSIDGDRIRCDCGYIARPPRDRSFNRELEAEIERMRQFLAVDPSTRGRFA